jgi:lia operon protein LiaI
MKKFGLLAAGGIAAIVLLANLGSLIGLAICAALLYLVFKQFLKAQSIWTKGIWGIIGLCILTGAASNIPAIFGLVAAYILYLVITKWNTAKTCKFKESDPFANFEKQWSELNQK